MKNELLDKFIKSIIDEKEDQVFLDLILSMDTKDQKKILDKLLKVPCFAGGAERRHEG